LGILIVGGYAVLAGLGEIVVGITGNYLGIPATPIPPSFSTVVIGSFYSLGGLSILTVKKWGAALGVFFIGAEMPGRVYLVITGIAPAAGIDAIKILIGGVIACSVVVYILTESKKSD